MGSYRYEAVNEQGKTVAGVIDAQSLDHANELLAGRGLAPLALRDEAGATGREGRLAGLMKQVNPEELILFTKQLSTMMRAGIPEIGRAHV